MQAPKTAYCRFKSGQANIPTPQPPQGGGEPFLPCLAAYAVKHGLGKNLDYFEILPCQNLD